VIFELHAVADHVTFDSQPDLGETVTHKAVLPLSAQVQITALRQVLKMGNWVWPVLRVFMK